jgi:hypothetical protein
MEIENKDLEPLTGEFRKVAEECARLFDGKQHDYGPGNIAKFGEIGVYVRLSDKIERLVTLVKSGKTPQNESLDDTLKDIANYAIIAMMIRKGMWPK